MADVKKIATRDSYGSALAELGASHPDLIVFDADLAGATKTDRKSTRLNSSHSGESRMPSSA